MAGVDFIHDEIPEGKDETVYVNWFNALVGYKLRSEYLKEDPDPEIEEQIARLLAIYPDAQEISEQMKFHRES